MNQEPLSSIAEFLNEAGWNYSVFLKAYTTSFATGTSSEQIVRSAIDNSALIEDIKTVTVPEVLSEIESSITYPGDTGAGPESAALASQEFSGLLSNLRKEVEALALSADRLEKFRFKKGHPAYPVFWDFAFLFVGAPQSTVLVGCSSD